jgi:hypothetical protein
VRHRPASLTPFGIGLILVTVVLVVAVCFFTQGTPVVIALVVVLLVWAWLHVFSTPFGQTARGEDPARRAEEPWRRAEHL